MVRDWRPNLSRCFDQRCRSELPRGGVGPAVRRAAPARTGQGRATRGPRGGSHRGSDPRTDMQIKHINCAISIFLSTSPGPLLVDGTVVQPIRYSGARGVAGRFRAGPSWRVGAGDRCVPSPWSSHRDKMGHFRFPPRRPQRAIGVVEEPVYRVGQGLGQGTRCHRSPIIGSERHFYRCSHWSDKLCTPIKMMRRCVVPTTGITSPTSLIAAFYRWLDCGPLRAAARGLPSRARGTLLSPHIEAWVRTASGGSTSAVASQVSSSRETTITYGCLDRNMVATNLTSLVSTIISELRQPYFMV